MKKTVPIFLAFLVMGVADSMGPLSNAVQKQGNRLNNRVNQKAQLLIINF
jgi:hypothetical protein